MMESVHARVIRLISAEHVEGLTAEERRDVHEHLAVCPACSTKAAALQRALSSLRSVSVRLDPALVEATQWRLRRRAAEMEARRSRLRPVWMVTALSALWMALTGPFIWRGLEWIGQTAGWAEGVWQSVFLLWWFLPATAMALAYLVAGGEDWIRWRVDSHSEGRRGNGTREI